LQGTTTSLQGSIVNDTAVIFNQSTDGTYAGSISGSGSLTKLGSGTVILTGANSYSGGTTVIAGTLQCNSGSLSGDTLNNAAVVFNQTSDGTYADV
ncbi:MAG: autotransporter-associated beta strand repeat-containing protein, partial [Simkania sp.]|nr:autotransporter-associated beta strand repeat-containing protein [Simkania sp.]